MRSSPFASEMSMTVHYTDGTTIVRRIEGFYNEDGHSVPMDEATHALILPDENHEMFVPLEPDYGRPS